MDNKVLEASKQAYVLWREKATDDESLSRELLSVTGQDEEIYERFYRHLSFGTAGLRGILGAGSNRMNVYTIRRATQGLANHLLSKTTAPKVAIGYDSRINSDLFAREAARVLAGNGISVHLYPQLMPVPCLSFATRQLQCDAGIMVTASHNPAKYNGYKVYGPDGCQLTEAEADAVLSQINQLGYFDGIALTDFDTALSAGKITYIPDSLTDAFMSAVRSRQQNPGVCGEAHLKLVYTPLNGAGNLPVRRILSEIGVTDVTVVPEQELPDGNFPTCPYPNPEIREALSLGLKLAESVQADLLLATDPDCDRVGIAVRHDGRYHLLSGNQAGVLLLDYICRSRKATGDLPDRPFAVKTIVSTKLADAVGASYGVEVKNVLTGFKYIGEQIAIAEDAGEIERFLFGFEESYGYLCGTHARDKDAVVASMLIAEMAALYKKEKKTLMDALTDLYRTHGWYQEQVASYSFEGASGMQKMSDIMETLRKDPPSAVAGFGVTQRLDYDASLAQSADGQCSAIPLPRANVLEYRLNNGCSVIIRPSGTEPKIKLYLSVIGDSQKEAQQLASCLQMDMQSRLGL